MTSTRSSRKAVTGVTAIYDRYSYDAEKRVALDVWGQAPWRRSSRAGAGEGADAPTANVVSERGATRNDVKSPQVRSDGSSRAVGVLQPTGRVPDHCLYHLLRSPQGVFPAMALVES